MKKQFVCSLNRNPMQLGWFVFVLGFYDSLGIQNRNFGGIQDGFAFVFEFWLPISFRSFGKDPEAIQVKDDLEKDIVEQAEELGRQVKEQEAKRAVLRTKRK